MFFVNFTHLQEAHDMSLFEVRAWTRPIPSSDLKSQGRRWVKLVIETERMVLPSSSKGRETKLRFLRLGFEGPIEVVNRGWGMDRFTAYLYETYGTRTSDRKSTMTLLMDWDRTGGKLQANLRRRLESFDVLIDEELRKVLMKTLKPETRVVESLGGLVGALAPHMEIEATLRQEEKL